MSAEQLHEDGGKLTPQELENMGLSDPADGGSGGNTVSFGPADHPAPVGLPDPRLAQREGPKPSIGRIVHYVIEEADVHQGLMQQAIGSHRPAIITGVFPSGCNLQVFLDTPNDAVDQQKSTLWVGTRPEGNGPGSWHWPERL